MAEYHNTNCTVGSTLCLVYFYFYVYSLKKKLNSHNSGKRKILRESPPPPPDLFVQIYNINNFVLLFVSEI